MFPSEIVLEQHRRDMQKAAEQHRLAQSLRDDFSQPSLWQRMRARLSIGQVQRSSCVELMPRPDVIAISR